VKASAPRRLRASFFHVLDFSTGTTGTTGTKLPSPAPALNYRCPGNAENGRDIPGLAGTKAGIFVSGRRIGGAKDAPACRHKEERFFGFPT
jgi:hypothetical protein